MYFLHTEKYHTSLIEAEDNGTHLNFFWEVSELGDPVEILIMECNDIQEFSLLCQVQTLCVNNISTT